ncbi:MAG: flavoprotein [Lachnospiraceae bacterium]|nr:flavoprotein [Lachnospiraceae bacterium]
MSKMSFEEAFISVVSDYVVQEVVKRYLDRSKKALVLFSGALIGIQEAYDCLNQLKSEGWSLTVAMSQSAKEIISENTIREKIGPDAIYAEGSPVDYRKLVEECNYVIIPCLTINTTAKVANGISDNLLTRIISRSMIVGKPIVAAIDGCCPDNAVRAKMGFHVTEAYKVRLRKNLEALRDYGIVLTSSKNLAQKVNQVLSGSFSFSNTHMTKTEAKDDQKKVKAQPLVGGTVRLDKNVISRNDILLNRQYKTIIVGKRSNVTALAQDEAYKYGIQIVKE